MSTQSQEDLRLKQRSNVTLKAVASITGQKAQEHQCRVTDLSATGARLHFEKTSSLNVGMDLTLKISIPSTIMQIQNSGKIMWLEKNFRNCTVGIKFTEFLSEAMIAQLTKN